ncbi:MAG: ATP-dependent DNA helicase RecG [Candidatus Onthomorpha sp.]|nr:ATP-dependent DNA helicase RecG [Bacteroidales bacterium]MDY4862180.1 ATP-dependent DNA helicase RecG [Candidatus Onthomorpha sp.]MCI5715651.1 ATP-dependent DNA helicase RecG [Bacteroidales bacterium]MCI6901360.1 ATP-dependent DNA helicase RecG [Bacteroidales bacterium]MCI7035267.1 ATP-dependent DNA helicase RecG [Bacteroidales bacterium]
MTDASTIKLSTLVGIGDKKASILAKELGLFTLKDLFEYYPYRYVDKSRFIKIAEVRSAEVYTLLLGKVIAKQIVGGTKSQRLVVRLADETGSIEMVFFRGIRWINESIDIGAIYVVFGKPNYFNGTFNLPHPEFEKFNPQKDYKKEKFMPLYNTTERMKTAFLASKQLSKIISDAVKKYSSLIEEILPQYIIDAYHLCSRRDAIACIHSPLGEETLAKARFRLKFEELFFMQAEHLLIKSNRKSNSRGFVFSKVGENFNTFFSKYLPFELTNAQKRVVKEIRNDMRTGSQMNRLLQGDVGSGKTLVALLSMLIALDNGYQATLIAPTEILAMQHFQSINRFIGDMNINVSLLTGSIKGKSRKHLLTSLADGSINILIGTHAILEENVIFNNLGLVVIDEQHRFGVEQRAKMWTKNTIAPHILVMTATPICRTLAMSIYGDLDYSVIDELPSGRKPILTTHLYDRDVLRLFDFMKKQIEQGRQIYVVYPLIKESEKLDLKDLMDGYESIERAFPLPQYQISIVHGQMKPEDKEYEMQRFKKGITNIMVATTVIEVGVDVPNATVMVIENAERFGLAQLHQLRGRVGRGANQSYCILRTKDELSSEARFRIETMCSTNDGFEISRADLQLRGPGDVSGTRQSGVLDLKVADIVKDEGLMAQVRTLAQNVLADDPHLTKPQNLPIRNYFMTKHKVSDFSMIS